MAVWIIRAAPECPLAVYSSWRSLGSRVSLSQSPKRFRDITVNRMAKPGIVDIHQESTRWSRPSATIEPQAGSGGGTPAPMKLSVASTRITMPTCNVATTMTVFIVPGSKWLNNILGIDAPAILAADT